MTRQKCLHGLPIKPLGVTKIMVTQTEQSESGVLDIIKLLVSAAALIGGLYAYYYYEPQVAQALRVLMVLGGTAAGIGIAMTSTQGQRLWHSWPMLRNRQDRYFKLSSNKHGIKNETIMERNR